MGLKQNLHTLKMKYKGPRWLLRLTHSIPFCTCPNETTHNGTHIKAADDLKRTMNMVIMSLVSLFDCLGYLMQGINTMLQTAEVTKALSFFSTEFLELFKLYYGRLEGSTLVVVSYGVGLIVEFIFAVIKGHEVEEGYLVTGMLVPLIVPVDIRLDVVYSSDFWCSDRKRSIWGTGMNILNPALTIRAFLFFAYPTWMSGDKVWVTGAVDTVGQPDAISGETILGIWPKTMGLEMEYYGLNF